MSGRKSKSPKEGSKSAADPLAELMEKLWLHDDPPEEYSYERKRSPKKMTSWKSYEEGADSAPYSPGVYEFKYKDDETPIYIGESGKLRQRIKNHRYGNQAIDEVVRDDEEELVVRFKRTNTKEEAKEEETRRIYKFEKKHGEMPLYNFKH